MPNGDDVWDDDELYAREPDDWPDDEDDDCMDCGMCRWCIERSIDCVCDECGTAVEQPWALCDYCDPFGA